jgi:hypothetical protein
MKLDATPTTIRDIAEAFKLAAILDDRIAQVDTARIAAWAEQVQRHNLIRADLLDGLQAFYDSPSDRAIQIGDLIHHARHAKRTRLDKEADEVREQRQEAHDVKAADEIHGIAAGFVAGPVKNKTPRLIAAEAALQCAVDKSTAQAAIAEFFAAKREAANA